MICTRCQQAIRPGDAYRTFDIDSASGAGATIHQHVKCPTENGRT
ncbi:hypothetical protein [Streptomyces formicae]|nr:hypothetical protein [Streptomyces formicae]